MKKKKKKMMMMRLGYMMWDVVKEEGEMMMQRGENDRNRGDSRPKRVIVYIFIFY